MMTMSGDDDFFTAVVGNLNESIGTNGNSSKVYTSSVPGQHSTCPGEQHTLAFYTRFMMPNGAIVVGVFKRAP